MIKKDGFTRRGTLNALVGASAAPHVGAAQLTRNQAADLIHLHNVFIDVDVGTAEAGMVEGAYFKIVDSSAGLSAVYRRDQAGSTLLFHEVTAAGLASTGAGKGAEMVRLAAPDMGAVPLSVTEALMAGVHTYNVWLYMTPAMRADALAGTKELDHSPALQACIDAAVSGKARQIFLPFSRGQIYNVETEVNIPYTSPADSGFMIVGDATPRYDPENGGHITGDPALPRLFSYDKFSTNPGSNNFTISRVNFYSSSKKKQALIQFTSRNNGPHRAFQFLECSAKGFDAVYLFDADLPDDPLILSAASVTITAGCYRGNNDVVRASNRIMGLSVNSGAQSEQGAKYSGRISGPVTFRDAMLEGQSNVINCDSDAPQLVVEDCYLEQIMGGYFARVKGTSPACSLRTRSNYVSRHHATDFYRVEGQCRVLENDELKIPQYDSLPEGLGPCRAAITFVGGIAYFGSRLLGPIYVSTETEGGFRGYLEPQMYPRGKELTKQNIGNVELDTPFGSTRYAKQVQGFPANYDNFTLSYAEGDIAVASALVRCDGGTPCMAVFSDSYSLMSSVSGVGLATGYEGKWFLLSVARRATTSGKVGRLRFGSQGTANRSSYTMDVAACGFDVIPAAEFETRNGQKRALVQLFNPFDPTFRLSCSSGVSATMVSAGSVHSVTCTAPGTLDGDIIQSSHSNLPAGLLLTATALPNNIRFDFINPTAAPIVLPEGTLRGVVL